ncbi:hypothetical protein COOONC_23041 [Cooperia oncophora]
MALSTTIRRAIFIIRIDSGPPLRKRIRDYEELYSKLNGSLQLSIAAPPRKKFLQTDTKLQEKRRQWIVALTQLLIADHHDK